MGVHPRRLDLVAVTPRVPVAVAVVRVEPDAPLVLVGETVTIAASVPVDTVAPSAHRSLRGRGARRRQGFPWFG